MSTQEFAHERPSTAALFKIDKKWKECTPSNVYHLMHG